MHNKVTRRKTVPPAWHFFGWSAKTVTRAGRVRRVDPRTPQSPPVSIEERTYWTRVGVPRVLKSVKVQKVVSSFAGAIIFSISFQCAWHCSLAKASLAAYWWHIAQIAIWVLKNAKVQEVAPVFRRAPIISLRGGTHGAALWCRCHITMERGMLIVVWHIRRLAKKQHSTCDLDVIGTGVPCMWNNCMCFYGVPFPT